jgi:hypothetical protein
VPVLLDDPASEPPPQLPERTASVRVQVSGNGTVISLAAAARGLSAGRSVRRVAATRIRCGVSGSACFAQPRPTERMRLQATSAPGFRFAGWSGRCSARAATCDVRAGEAQTVGASFVPAARRASVSVKLRPPRWTKVGWQASVGKATLVVGGTISARVRSRLQVRRPGGGPLLTHRARLGPGPFRLGRVLRRGKLAKGAQLFPGAFVVTLTGTAPGVRVPFQLRTLELRAPREGVVRNAFATSSRTGRKQVTLPFGVTEAWANFRFAAQPRGGPITVTWYDRSRRPLGSVTKSNRPLIQTGIGSPAAIPRGDWTAELRVGGRLVRTLLVRIV